jgi:hypothetical protein
MTNAFDNAFEHVKHEQLVTRQSKDNEITHSNVTLVYTNSIITSKRRPACMKS